MWHPQAGGEGVGAEGVVCCFSHPHSPGYWILPETYNSLKSCPLLYRELVNRSVMSVSMYLEPKDAQAPSVLPEALQCKDSLPAESLSSSSPSGSEMSPVLVILERASILLTRLLTSCSIKGEWTGLSPGEPMWDGRCDRNSSWLPLAPKNHFVKDIKNCSFKLAEQCVRPSSDFQKLALLWEEKQKHLLGSAVKLEVKVPPRKHRHHPWRWPWPRFHLSWRQVVWDPSADEWRWIRSLPLFTLPSTTELYSQSFFVFWMESTKLLSLALIVESSLL